ncbi:hypothetical protein WN51_03000 [Melipona quadrifasciata]|uniref:Uncharacterized protein n=1 Tax=Melipona quadrifasciata TaxID=166423 RepID=A0A0M8ZVA4_9HYME|nr:hypothetical protein WN51_03000 [Melipona quadrifasciata]
MFRNFGGAGPKSTSPRRNQGRSPKRIGLRKPKLFGLLIFGCEIIIAMKHDSF